jgi:hypothetical protein
VFVAGEVNVGASVVPVTIVINAVSVHALLFVNVMIVVPVAKPVTTPLAETVALAGFEETHALLLAGVVEAVSVIVLPAPTDDNPEINGDSIVTVFVSVLEQPFIVYV